MVGRGWVPAGELSPGDQLVGSRGETVVVVDVEVRAEQADHFNIEVADWHTYFVAGDVNVPAVWVHNRCIAPEVLDAFGETRAASRAMRQPYPHGYEIAPEGMTVRRFMSRGDMKEATKRGIFYDPTVRRPGIPTASTNLEPVGIDSIRAATGARSADAFVDIDISGMRILRRTTKEGHLEIVLHDSVTAQQIVNSGRVARR